LKAVKEEDRVIIFTACLAVSSGPAPYDDIDQFKQYINLAEGRGVPLVVVNLVCDLESNKGRLRSEERKELGKTKLVDTGILEQVREETSILD
jgi:hypothetical protein